MQMKRSNPTAWWAFWIGLLGLILMPIPLFIGFFLGTFTAPPLIQRIVAAGEKNPRIRIRKMAEK